MQNTVYAVYRIVFCKFMLYRCNGNELSRWVYTEIGGYCTCP